VRSKAQDPFYATQVAGDHVSSSVDDSTPPKAHSRGRASLPDPVSP
jgi:hypothetical protein